MAQGLLISVRRHLGSARDSRATAFDACEGGHATAESSANAEQIRQIGVWHERWRRKGETALKTPLACLPASATGFLGHRKAKARGPE
eukprot:6734550-Pyramimonas_sp.AAC.1